MVFLPFFLSNFSCFSFSFVQNPDHGKRTAMAVIIQQLDEHDSTISSRCKTFYIPENDPLPPFKAVKSNQLPASPSMGLKRGFF